MSISTYKRIQIRFTGFLAASIMLFLISGCDGLPFGATPETTNYHVIYDDNGADSGIVPIDSNQYAQHSTVTVLGNNGDLTKAAYTFSGWNTSADGTGTTYAAGETFLMETDDVTLYAIWEGNSDNNAPSDIQLSTSEIQERVAIGTTVGTLSVVDDAGDSYTFSTVAGVGNATFFTISGNSLVTAAAIDYESNSTLSVTIEADDGELTFSKEFTISVIDNYDFLAADYIDLAPGKGVKYAVTDESGSLAFNVWAVAQSVPSALTGDYDYIVTLTKDGTDGGYFSNSTLGGRVRVTDGQNANVFYSGMPVGNQANFYRNFIVPEYMEIGDTITEAYWGTYEIIDAGEVTVGSETFQNCIKIQMSRSITGRDWDYTNGTGFAILAPGIGIVQIEFTRAISAESYSGTAVTYNYLEHATLNAHSISGTITTDGTTPAVDLYIQIATSVLDASAKTDASGAFTLPGIYGPDATLYLGYNGNDGSDDDLDFDYPSNDYPKEYVIGDVDGDIEGLFINLSNDQAVIQTSAVQISPLPGTQTGAIQISPLPGTYKTFQTVTLSPTTSGATIHYTTDGSDPTSASQQYTVPITLDTTYTRIRAVEIVDGTAPSAVADAEYRIGFGYSSHFGGRGGGGGLFNGPTDVEIDSIGNIYVADALNYRVQKFSSTGVFDSFLATQGYEAGQTELPVGIAIDGSDNVYIADRSHGVIIFDSAGAFVREWNGDGTADGRIDGPIGIDVTSDGSSVYVAERDANRIRKFDAYGNQLASWGSAGTGDGQFQTPSGLALDASDNVYVVDIENLRIQKFQADGAFVTSWVFTTYGNTSWPMIYDLLIDGDNLYVADKRPATIGCYNLSGTSQGDLVLTSGNGDGEFSSPQGLAMDASGNLVVVDSNNSRIQTISTTGAYISQFGSFGGDDPGYFNTPFGIAYSATRDTIYVTETRNNRVQELSLSGTPVNAWGTAGYNDGEFYYPQGIALDSADNVYIADYYSLQKFSSTGTFIWRDTEAEITACVDDSDNIYTFGSGVDIIRKLDTDGIQIAAWGVAGTGVGEFTQPGGLLWVDGYIYALDENGNSKKLIKFTDTGTFVIEWQIGYSSSSGTPPLYGMSAVDDGTNILIANKRRSMFEIYTLDGTLLHEFGTSGFDPGEFRDPTGVALDSTGNLYIVDSDNNRVQVFSR